MKKLLKLKIGVFAVMFSALVSFGSMVKADFPEKPIDMTVLFGGTAKSIALLFSELMFLNLYMLYLVVS